MKVNTTDINNTNLIGVQLLRIIIGFIVVKNIIIYYAYSELFYGLKSFESIEAYHTTLSTFNIPYLYLPFELKYFPFFISFVVFLLGIFMILNKGRVIVPLMLFIILVILNLRNPWLNDGSDNVILVLLPFLALTLYEKSNSSFFIQLHKASILGIKIQICIIYFFTAFYKFQGEMWQNGIAVYYAILVDEFNVSTLNTFVAKNLYIVVIATYSTLIFEIAFPFLIWFKKTKLFIILIGVMFHLSIWLLMMIDNFSLIMVSSYFIFLSDKEYNVIFNKLKLFLNLFSLKLQVWKKR